VNGPIKALDSTVLKMEAESSFLGMDFIYSHTNKTFFSRHIVGRDRPM
jgi:hypothetical protein